MLIWLVLPLYSSCGYDLSYHFIQVVNITCLTSLFKLWIWLVLPLYSGCGYDLSYHFIRVVDMTCLTTLLWIWLVLPIYSGYGYVFPYLFIHFVDIICLTSLFKLWIWLVLPLFSGCGYTCNLSYRFIRVVDMTCLTSLFILWIWLVLPLCSSCGYGALYPHRRSLSSGSAASCDTSSGTPGTWRHQETDGGPTREVTMHLIKKYSIHLFLETLLNMFNRMHPLTIFLCCLYI